MQKKLTGWLMLLIVILVLSVGSAGSTSFRMDHAFKSSLLLYPSLNSAIISVKFWNWAAVCVSLYTAWVIYRMRHATLHLAQIGLVARFLCITCGSFSFPMLAGMSDNITAGLVRDATYNLIASLIFTSLWLLYLTRSAQVRAIYGV